MNDVCLQKTPWSGHRSRVDRCLWPQILQIVVVWCWFGFPKGGWAGLFCIGTMGWSLFCWWLCICKFWEEHGFGAWITVCEWYYWCVSLVHSTLQTLSMRTLASMFCSTIEVSALVHTGTSYFQMRISVLYHSFTQPLYYGQSCWFGNGWDWESALVWETCFFVVFFWVVTVPNAWALSLCCVNEVVVMNQSFQ